MSKQEEIVDRNIELSAEFSRYLFENPEIEKETPVDAEIVLLPEVFTALTQVQDVRWVFLFCCPAGIPIPANGEIE